MRLPCQIVVLVTLASLLVACGGSSGGGSAVPPGPVAIYQVDARTMDGVGIWRPDDGVIDGDAAPTSVIGGATNAVIDGSYGVHHDSRGDTLIVGDINTATIRFWDGVSALDGDAAPTRVLTGASTQITSDNAYEVYVDETRDLLYVAYSDGVFVFANAATIDGDVAPVRTITGATTGLVTADRDKRLFVDEVNDRLYVVDGDTATVLVWDAASTVDGDTAPSRTIVGGNTGFNFPWGIAVDVGRDILYVADESADAVFIFDGASSLDGDVAPDRILMGATSTLAGPAGIDVDPISNRLYVSHYPSDAAISIWDDASTVDGDVAPTRSLTGASTGIDSTADVDVSR